MRPNESILSAIPTIPMGEKKEQTGISYGDQWHFERTHTSKEIAENCTRMKNGQPPLEYPFGKPPEPVALRRCSDERPCKACYIDNGPCLGAALAPQPEQPADGLKAGEWVEWKGGEPPLDIKVIPVSVRVLWGASIKPNEYDLPQWTQKRWWDWTETGESAARIVAYRLPTPQERQQYEKGE